MRAHLIVCAALLLALYTCGWDGGSGNMFSFSRIPRLARQLKANDLETRTKALRELQELSKLGALRPKEAADALRAAASQFPPLEHDWQDAGESLIRVAAADPSPEHVAIIFKNFGSYSKSAKLAALSLLTRIPSQEATKAFVTLALECARLGDLDQLSTQGFDSNPRDADILFPTLFGLAPLNPRLEWDVYLLGLTYAQSGMLSQGMLSNETGAVRAAYRRYAQVLRPQQSKQGVAWMWEDEYGAARDKASLLLDFMGYLPTDAVEEDLREALTFRDARLVHFAAMSLLRQGLDVASEALKRIAASPEMRGALYDELEKQGRLALYPAEHATQAALAEASMVHWLTFPTELATVPDEIELMKIVEVETTDGPAEYYLYRFRSFAPWAADHSWMAGVAGPFSKGQLSTYGSDTFSSFEAWDAKTPEEHVQDITGTVDQVPGRS